MRGEISSMKNPFKNKIKKQEKVVEDKSEYDCSPCGGDGLKSQTEVCPDCLGTGKKGEKKQEFPDGTMQLRPNDGSYIMTNGEWVKEK